MTARLIEPAPGRGLLLGGLHLAALWSLAVAQPLFDLLGRNPDFFVARGNTAGDILILTAVLILVVPAAMLGIEAVAARIGPGPRDAIHLLLIAGLVALIGLQVLGQVADGPGALLVAAALAIGAAGAAAYARTELAPQILTILSPAPLVVAALFLLGSDVRKLVLPQEDVAAAEIAIPGRTPVVIILFDEFPGTSLLDANGEVDRSLYPSFAELAEAGTLFPNATTEADLTPRAAPAVMTGAYPSHDQLPTAADQPDSIFTLLGETYEQNVREPETSICPAEICGERARPPAPERLDSLVSDLRIAYQHLLLPKSLEGGLPPVDETFSGFGEPETGADGEAAAGVTSEPEAPAKGSRRRGETKVKGDVERSFSVPAASFVGRGADFQAWLSKIDGDPRRLDFIHTELPHVPYTYYPDGQRYVEGLLEADGLRDSFGRNPPAAWPTGLLQQRQLLQIGYVDRLLGKTIDRLKAVGLWDRAIVAVTADHGASFRPGAPRRVPTRGNLPEIASVPLIVKGPGIPKGEIDERPARTTDIVPTIADILEIEPQASVTGASLLREPPPRPEVEVTDRYQRLTAMPFAAFVRARDRLLRQKVGRFGSEAGWEAVYRWGPAPSLIGRRASELPRFEAPGAAATVLGAAPFANADPAASLIPGAIRAQLTGVEPGAPLAVAVNGRIAATGRAYQGGDQVRAFAVVPPASLRPGRNTVELFELDGSRLASLGGVNLPPA